VKGDRTRKRGFTLLEVLVGLGLAAVVAGIGVVRLATFLEGARLAGAARTVATGLRLARGLALSSGASVEVALDAAAGTCDTRDARGTLVERRRLPPGVAFAALPARRRVSFGGLGTGENATLVLAASGRRRSVVVNQRGRVRVQ
jgi:general secretion pathway protein H